MKKIFSSLLVLVFIFMTTINVFAGDGPSFDVSMLYDKAIDNTITLNYKDATSLVSVKNGTEDITSKATFTTSTVDEATNGRVEIEEKYLHELTGGLHYITITYGKVDGGNGSQIIELNVVESTMPTITPATATHNGADLEFSYTTGSGSLTTNIIKSIIFEEAILSPSNYTYSASSQKLVIKDSFLNTKDGTIVLQVVFDNAYSTKATISINCDYKPSEPTIVADIVSELKFGLTKTVDTNYIKEYKVIRSDNKPFPFSEFNTQFSAAVLNVNGPITAVFDKDASNNTIFRITSDTAATLTDYAFDAMFVKKSTSESDTIKFTGKIMADPTKAPTVVKAFNVYGLENSETFDNQLANYTFSIYDELVTINYYGVLDGKYDFNFETALDSNFGAKHPEFLVRDLNNILFPKRQMFPSDVTITIKNLEGYENPVLYKMNADGTLSEIDYTYNKANKTFSFTARGLAYGYLISSGTIHNNKDEVSPNYGGSTGGGTTNPGTGSGGGTNGEGTGSGGSTGGSGSGNTGSGGSGSGSGSGGNTGTGTGSDSGSGSGTGNGSGSGTGSGTGSGSTNGSGSNSGGGSGSTGGTGGTTNPNNNPETGLLDIRPLVAIAMTLTFVMLFFLKRNEN